MAKKRTSKKTSIRKNSPSQLNTKNILIIVLVVAVLLILISSYTGNVSREGFKSSKTAKSTYQTSSDSSSTEQSKKEKGVQCDLTGTKRCNIGANGRHQVQQEKRCNSGYVSWVVDQTCNSDEVCHSRGNNPPECAFCPITENVYECNDNNQVEIRTYNCLREVLSGVVTSEFSCEDL